MPLLHAPLMMLYQSVSQNGITVMLKPTSRVPHVSDICIFVLCLNEYCVEDRFVLGICV